MSRAASTSAGRASSRESGADESAGSGTPRARKAGARQDLAAGDEVMDGAPPVALQRGIALGVLAMLPLFLAYEIAQGRSGGSGRNAAELILTLPFTALGFAPGPARIGLLVLATLASAWFVFHERLGLVVRVGRVAAEGLVCALVLGPLLLVLQRALDLGVPAALGAGTGGTSVPPLGTALVVVSGAAFEEIVFRVGIQSAIFVLALEVGRFYTSGSIVPRASAEVSSIAISSLVFAAMHLSTFLHPLGSGGEPWDAAVFAWRFLAGVCLAILFRLRGPGVAAWTHAFFNLALYVGAGPDVFL